MRESHWVTLAEHGTGTKQLTEQYQKSFYFQINRAIQSEAADGKVIHALTST